MNDELFLNLALKQAKIQKGFCCPNPSVGSLLVDKNQTILASDYHQGPGLPHAEVNVLKQVDFKASSDDTLYVTLEPCCHWGRTPPCVDAIIRSGVKRVVYAYKDPNPLVSGKGADLLKAAGIKCDHIELKSINDFYSSYRYWHLTKQPFVTAKIALSLNGAIANANGNPVQITGEELAIFTHKSRKLSDAILTTANTIIHDDPQLNVRMKNTIFTKPVYILDSHLRSPLTARIFKTAKSITLFHGDNINIEKREQFISQGARCTELEYGVNGLNLQQAIALIGQDGIHDLWVEVGGKCFASLIQHKLLQRAYIYISLHWLKHGKIAFPMGISLGEISQMITWRQFGSDVLCDIRF